MIHLTYKLKLPIQEDRGLLILDAVIDGSDHRYSHERFTIPLPYRSHSGHPLRSRH